jgi:hypothetical protein
LLEERTDGRIIERTTKERTGDMVRSIKSVYTSLRVHGTQNRQPYKIKVLSLQKHLPDSAPRYPRLQMYNFIQTSKKQATYCVLIDNIVPSRVQLLLSLLPLTKYFGRKRPSSGVSVMPELFHCPLIHITCNCNISRFKILNVTI